MQEKLNKDMLEKIKSYDIVAMADELGIHLSRSSSDKYVTCCIFHEENTPSMMFFRSSNLYHCFGCLTTGDVIDLVRKVKNISFRDSVRFVASKMDMEIPDEYDDTEFDETLPWKAIDGYGEVDQEDLFTFLTIESRDILSDIYRIHGYDSNEFEDFELSREKIFKQYDEAEYFAFKIQALHDLERLNQKMRKILLENS